jgi:hypothetical protein
VMESLYLVLLKPEADLGNQAGLPSLGGNKCYKAGFYCEIS